ncbi:MAG: hypothetical protein DCC55_13270 [Chloroflexi bacterium]|nr:MAG: hypothetical protein DCC55_13270 [Chloroflexota bacterium]
MIPLVAMTATRTNTSPWLASVYAGVISAIFAVITTFLFPNVLIGWIVGYLLIGVGPVIGYQLATGQGLDWRPIVGGILGSVLPIIILWPILVGALAKDQSVGKLILGALIGAILGWIVFLLIATVMGQDPAFFPFAFVMYNAVWAGTLGAVMVAWAE